MTDQTKRTRRPVAGCLLALGALLTYGGGAVQNVTVAATQPDADSIEEIIVTAQRREQTLQDTPVAVTAFTAQALEARGIQNLSQISQFTPSLLIEPTNRPGGGGSSISSYIRGVGTGDYLIPTDPAIGIYVDGVYIARSLGGLISLPDIERIEVLKGPQGTLYGRNTLGGAISIVTTTPELTGDPIRLVEAHLGTDGRRDLIASINTPVVEDKIAAKLMVATLNFDGYGRSLYTGADLGNERRFITRGALRYKVSDDLMVDFDVDYTNQNQNPPVSSVVRYFDASPLVPLYNAVVAPHVGPQLGLPAGSTYSAQFVPSNPYYSYAGPGVDDFTSDGASITVTYTPSAAFQIKSITAARNLDVNIAVDGDQQPFQIVSDATQERSEQASEELQFSGRVLDSRLNYVAGLYGFYELSHSAEDLQIFHGLYEALHNPKLALDTLTYQHLSVTNYAAYTQETFAVTPTVNVTAGGRLNYEEKDYSAYQLAPQLGTVSAPDQTSTPHWTNFLPKVGVDWKMTPDSMLYTSWSKGFKSGGISPPSGPLKQSPYDPETLTTWEVGEKTSWLDKRLSVDSAAYLSRYRDVQLTGLVDLPNGSIGKPVLNGGNANIWGLETEIVAVPTSGLQLNLSAAYTHDRFASLTPGAIAALGAFVGERLPNIPDFNASFGAQYAYSIAAGKLLLRADVSEIGKSQLTIGDPTSYQGAYTLVNARLAFDVAAVNGLEFAVQGINLTNRLYFTYDKSQATGNEQLVEPGLRREVYVSARYSF